MKIFIIIIALLASLNLYSKDELPVMLKVKSNFEIKPYIVEIFRSGAEESLTSNGYVLISKQQQEEALKEQAKQQNSDCYDDACLVDTGKMMAARMIFVTDINKAEETYLFKVRLLDLESGSVKRTVIKLYKDDFSNIDKLLKFSKSLTSEVLSIKAESKDKNKFYFKVKFNSNPKGASIYVDDIYAGKAPLHMDVEKGLRKFRVSLNDYNIISYEEDIKSDITKDLKLVPKEYTINIKSSQEKAKVYYKNKYIGETPNLIKIKAKDIYEKIVLKKPGFYIYSHEITRENLDKTLSVNLVELEKYKLKINTKPKSAKIIMNHNSFGDLSFNSGETQVLTKGVYSLKLKKKGYKASVKYIELDSNKELDFDMYKSETKVLRTYLLSDITIAKDLKYLSAGLGFEVLNFIKGRRDFTLLGVDFYKNIADDYFYLNLFSTIKWELISGFSLGLSVSAIIADEFKTPTGALLIEYKYVFADKLFIKASVKAGVSYFDETNADDFDMLFMTSGISIGFNGIGE